MPITKEQFEQILKERLQTTYLEVYDESGGCGSAFKVLIVSPLFRDKSLLERQRLVHDAIKEEMKNIHALSFKKCWTPEQYEQLKSTLK